MTGAEQEQWLGPVQRDGRWWMVRADGDRVAHGEGERWRPGWPPSRRGLLTGTALALTVLVALGGAVLLVAVGRVCLVPECGPHPIVAVQAPSSTGRLPTVLAAPCSRTPVDEVLVQRLVGAQRESMLRLVRTGAGARSFPLDRPVAGYRETTGRAPQDLVDLLAGGRRHQDDLRAAQASGAPLVGAADGVTVIAVVTYANGSSDWEGLPVEADGRIRYSSIGPPGNVMTGEDFAANAAGSDVCLHPVVRPDHYLLLLAALLTGLGVAVAVRSVRRGRYADELVRLANGQVPAGTR